MSEAIQKPRIARLALHNLRRTCRTGLSILRVPAHIAERVLNHVQPGAKEIGMISSRIRRRISSIERSGGYVSRRWTMSAMMRCAVSFGSRCAQSRPGCGVFKGEWI
jgi:hypothetical protein